MNRAPRKLLFALLAALALAPAAARAWGGSKAGRLGLGLRAGSPSGLTGKYWFDNENALDIAVGAYGYYYGSVYSGLNLHCDYLWHRYGVFGNLSSEAYNSMPLYFGIGGMYSSPGVAGVRGVAGITWLFEDAPFDLFFDLAPTLVATPFMGFGIDAGLGGRYYF